jgi:hypothetical protein
VSGQRMAWSGGVSREWDRIKKVSLRWRGLEEARSVMRARGQRRGRGEAEVDEGGGRQVIEDAERSWLTTAGLGGRGR